LHSLPGLEFGPLKADLGWIDTQPYLARIVVFFSAAEPAKFRVQYKGCYVSHNDGIARAARLWIGLMVVTRFPSRIPCCIE